MKKQGQILLHDEDWITGPTMLWFWANILFMADDAGSVDTTLSTLARELHMSIQQVRTCLANIESNKRLTHQATKQGTKITICGYESYKGIQHTEQHTVQHTINTPSNTPKEVPLVPPNGFSPNNPSSLTPYNPPQENLKERDTDVSPKKRDKPVSAPTDYSFILDLWNSSAKRSIPKIRAISPARREKIKLRLKEMGGVENAKGILDECFKKISESDFCNGATGKWTATFDWFFENEKNWLKVLEGNYDNRQAKTQLEIFAENVAKADAYYEQRYHGYGGASPYGDQAGGGTYGPDEQ